MKEVTTAAKEVGKWGLIGAGVAVAWEWAKRVIPTLIPAATLGALEAAAIPGLQVGALIGGVIYLAGLISRSTAAPAKA